MLASAILRGIRPSVSAVLNAAAQQPGLLAGCTQHRDFASLGTYGQGIFRKTHLFTAAQKVRMIQIMKATTEAGEKVHAHATHFKIERYWAAGMLPLLPAAYFIHGPVMDTLLAVALTMHIHWGLFAVAQDYARPFVVGETLSKIIVNGIYVVTILMFAGLLHFNYNDVGLTKAFEMVWDL